MSLDGPGAGTLAGVALGAALLSAALVRLLRPLFARYALARPNARSSHAVPTPQGGGIPVLAGAAVAALPAMLVWWGALGLGPLLVPAAAVAALALVGLVDDVRPLSPVPRLAAQIACTGALVAVLDPAPMLPWLPSWAERALLVLAGVWWVNLVNFMDGIDWITCAALVPLTAALALFSLAGWLPPGPGLASAALCGGLCGFAPANRPVARLFLGDVGSLPIGLVSGAVLLTLAAAGGLAAALLLPLYYLADASLTLTLRLRRGERVWEAHRSHFYQRAVAGGLSVLAVDRHVFVLNAALAGLAAVTLAWPSPALAAGALSAGAVLVGLTLRRFARGRPDPRSV